jgi:hypothetical protein
MGNRSERLAEQSAAVEQVQRYENRARSCDHENLLRQQRDQAKANGSATEIRRNRSGTAAPYQLGKVDKEQTDSERAEHPNVAARAQERQNGETFRDQSQQEQSTGHG